jgi:outer membrane lipoprotein-sorting protein
MQSIVCTLALLLLAGPAYGQTPSFASILKKMHARFEQITDYQCRFRTFSTNGTQSREVLLAYYYRTPGQIRMEVLEGPNPGAILIYNRRVQPEQVRVIAGNKLMAFMQRMFYGEFFPLTNKWVVDLRGNGIHESDWRNFIIEHEKYLHLGTSRFVDVEMLNGYQTYLFKLISNNPDATMSIKEEDVWVDVENYFPVQFFQYDSQGQLARKTTITELQFNTGLSERLFLEF